MEKTAAELFNEYDELEKQSKVDEKVLHDAEQEILYVQKEILKLQLKKKDLEIAKGPLAFKVKMQNTDLRLLKSAGFKARNSGL
jgi:uncharacterized protein YhaN